MNHIIWEKFPEWGQGDLYAIQASSKSNQYLGREGGNLVFQIRKEKVQRHCTGQDVLQESTLS